MCRSPPQRVVAVRRWTSNGLHPDWILTGWRTPPSNNNSDRQRPFSASNVCRREGVRADQCPFLVSPIEQERPREGGVREGVEEEEEPFLRQREGERLWPLALLCSRTSNGRDIVL